MAASALVARRLALTAVLAVCLVIFSAATASAHSDLLQASPSPGSSVGGQVDFIDLVFTDPVDDFVMSVTGPSGEAVGGEVTVADGHLIRYAMDPLSQEGQYQVDYSMISADDDPTEGGFAFAYSAGAAQPLRISPATVPDGASFLSPTLLGVAMAVAALGLVIGAMEWQRRRSDHSPAA